MYSNLPKTDENIISNFSRLFYTTTGLIFLRNDGCKVIELFLFISLHGFYLWSISRMTDYLDNEHTINTLGILKSTSCYSRFIEMYSTIIKLIWCFKNHGKIRRTLQLLQSNDKPMEIYGFVPKHRITTTFLGVLFLMALALVWEFEDIKSFKTFYMYTWIFALTKDLIEFHFWESIMMNLGQKLTVLNRHVSEVRKTLQGEIYQKSNSDYSNKKIVLRIERLRQLSLKFFEISELTHYIGAELTLPISITFVVKVVQIINCAYSLIMVMLKIEGHTAARPIVWMLFIFGHCVVLLRIWNFVQQEANRTVIILHDIWNKYAERKGINEKLLYLQFLSMRFLACRLKFTAYGFFSLDWSLLHTIVASAATYIIILVQLKK